VNINETTQGTYLTSAFSQTRSKQYGSLI